MAPMPSNRANFGVAVLNGMIYTIGGDTEGNKAERFDPKTNKWECIADMACERFLPACSAMNSRVYVSGGVREGPLNECYDPERNVWEEMPSMQIARKYAAAVCFEDKIYVTGGCGDSDESLDSMEVFDGHKWTNAPSMRSARSDHSSIVFQGNLWVIGGEKGDDLLNSCEQFNFVCQQWTYVQVASYTVAVQIYL